MPRVDPDSVDRVVKLLVDADPTLTFEAAAELLRTYRLQIRVDSAACRNQAWQAGVLTAVNAGMRAVHGGVRVVLAEDVACLVPWARGRRLSEALAELGAEIIQAGDVFDWGAPTIAFGSAPSRVDQGATAGAPVIRPVATQWVGGVVPWGTMEPVATGAGACKPASVIAAVLSAAIAVSESFQWLRGYAIAGDRSIRVSLWDPDGGSDGPMIGYLPAELWLLGLGHLGQAYAWLLTMLPYAIEDMRALVLQDDDRLSKANRATSMLHRAELVGMRKTRLAASVMDTLGWETRLVERRFHGGAVYATGDPRVLLGGVDNVQARRQLDDTGFPLIVDAGLGAGPDGYLGMTIRRLPSGRSSREIWPATTVAGPAPIAGAAYVALEAETGDRCGVELLAGRTVATAFVGVACACWVVGGLLRELHGGPAFAFIDHSLRDPGRVVSVAVPDAPPLRLASTPCAT